MAKIFVGIIIISLLIGGFIISRVAERGEEAPAGPTRALNKAPDFELPNYDGKLIKSSDFIGQFLVINSWAAWCPFCKKELVDFAEAQKEFGDQIAIIAIDRAESKVVAKKYSDELGVTEDLIFLLDPDDSFYQAIGGFSMPETIFVDKFGNIIYHKRGPMDLAEIRQRIKDLLSP